MSRRKGIEEASGMSGNPLESRRGEIKGPAMVKRDRGQPSSVSSWSLPSCLPRGRKANKPTPTDAERREPNLKPEGNSGVLE